MSTPAREFPLFSKLPTELREEIWRYCLPRRVCELDVPLDEVVFWGPKDQDGPWPCELRQTSYTNGRPPQIARVCHESRCVAFKAGGILLDFSSDRPPEAQWQSWRQLGGVWQDRARDSAHLSWTSAYEPDWPYYGSPLHCLAWDASRLSGGGSMVIKYLDKSFGSPNPFELVIPRVGPAPMNPLSADKLRDLEALKQLSRWRVVMRVIVVHLDFPSAAETGLFGLLGDAQVQIVDITEAARLGEFFDLAEACERSAPVTVHQDFRRDCALALEQALRASVVEQFRSEELAAVMRPAIMFRLCTRMCNRVGCELGRSWIRPTGGRSEHDRGRRGRGRGRAR